MRSDMGHIDHGQLSDALTDLDHSIIRNMASSPRFTVLSFVGRGLPMDRSPIRGIVLPNVENIHNFRILNRNRLDWLTHDRLIITKVKR
jgi:hypothetical protein